MRIYVAPFHSRKRFHVAGGRCGAKRDQICTGRTLFTSPTEQWARKTRYLPTAAPKGECLCTGICIDSKFPGDCMPPG